MATVTLGPATSWQSRMRSPRSDLSTFLLTKPIATPSGPGAEGQISLKKTRPTVVSMTAFSLSPWRVSLPRSGLAKRMRVCIPTSFSS